MHIVLKSLGSIDVRKILILIPLLLACNFSRVVGDPQPSPVPSTNPTQMPRPTNTPAPTNTPTPSNTPTPTLTPTPIFVGVFPDPGDYDWVPVVSHLQRPVDITHAGDERLFVVEQRGVIYVIEDGQVLEPPFLDLRDRVNNRANEQGLLGLAFHPDYAQNSFFYVNYTDVGGRTTVSRFQVSENPDQALADSEALVLSVDQPFSNHNGGGIKFGPDGFLYIGTGDGGSQGDPQGNGQRVDTLLGKMLRIDVDRGEPYTIPVSNPFSTGEGRGEIWAYGLRNPWRFSFDSATGDLYIGDVGQRNWEEVNFQVAGSHGGENYGWNIREGAHAYTSGEPQGLTDPIAEYSHGEGCSVTGGVVVRSATLPEWQGVYLYADYCLTTLWGALQTVDGGWENAILFDTGYRISSFGEGADGAVYLLDHGGGVYKLEPRS